MRKGYENPELLGILSTYADYEFLKKEAINAHKGDGTIWAKSGKISAVVRRYKMAQHALFIVNIAKTEKLDTTVTLVDMLARKLFKNSFGTKFLNRYFSQTGRQVDKKTEDLQRVSEVVKKYRSEATGVKKQIILDRKKLKDDLKAYLKVQNPPQDVLKKMNSV